MEHALGPAVMMASATVAMIVGLRVARVADAAVDMARMEMERMAAAGKEATLHAVFELCEAR